MWTKFEQKKTHNFKVQKWMKGKAQVKWWIHLKETPKWQQAWQVMSIVANNNNIVMYL
jgi:hypothetical protein